MFDISIIIPVYNSKSTLKDAVESVLKQKFKRFKPNIEIILSIDDCQNYKKIIFSKKENINIKHIQTRIIRSGPGHARNIGFKFSSGKFIGFLDSDDKYSDNYLDEMIGNIRKEKILTAPTHIFRDKTKIVEFKGRNNTLCIDELINYPCTFHPFLERNLFQKYESKHSQDIYNLTQFLNQKKIKVLKNTYYILNLRKNSLTQNKKFEHELKQAYKYYLIKSSKEKKGKIAQHFAKRLILNKKYEMWKIKNKNNTYYEYLGGLRCI